MKLVNELCEYRIGTVLVKKASPTLTTFQKRILECVGFRNNYTLV